MKKKGKPWRRSRRDRADAGGQVLFTRMETRPGKTLMVRLGVIFFLIALITVIFWLDRAGLKDGADGEMSFSDILYFTAVTLTTTGYGDIVPVTERARLIDALVLTPIRLTIWLIFLGTTYEFVVQRMVEDYRMAKLQARLQNHVIVCGYGRRGAVAARELVENGQPPESIVVIDPEESAMRDAAERGFTGLCGDAAREGILTKAGIAKAGAVIVCTGRDDTNVLIVLTARHLNPAVKIVSSVEDEENLDLIKQGGADVAVSTPKVGGYLLADAVVRSHTASYVCDLLSAGGSVNLVERPARDDEIGLTMREIKGALVLGLRRGEQKIEALEQPETPIRQGDLLIAIEPGAAGGRTGA